MARAAWNSANGFVFYGKDAELTGDREDQETSMLALHLLQAALVHLNTIFLQRILEDPAWAPGARSRRCFGRTSTPTGRSNSTWIAGWTSAGLLQPILRDPQASTPRPDRDWPGPRGCDASPTQAPAPELVLRSGLWWEGLLGGVGR